MNKRFSTLLATALVAGGLSANAQTTVVGTVIEEIPAVPVRNYVLAAQSNFTTGNVLGGSVSSLKVVDAGSRGVFVQAQSSLAADINDELWTIAFEPVQGSNRFVLKNKATGLTLSFDPNNAIATDASGNLDVSSITTAQDHAGSISQGAEDTKWTWVSAPNAKADLDEVMPLTCAFKSDSTMSLLVTTGSGVYAYKYANDKVPSSITGATQLKVQAVQPGSVAMNATALNVLNDATNGKYFTLSTGKEDLIGDVISGVKFQATDEAGNTGYVALKELGTAKYLRVDTAVHVATGANKDNLYQLARKELKAGETLSAPNYFKIEKNLFSDSVFVSIKQVGTRFTYDADANGSKWATAMQTTHDAYDYCTLSSVLLTKDTEVMTFFEPAIPTTATLEPENLQFAVSSPEADKTLASLKDGVYLVKNKEGKYLAMPIYTAKKDNDAEVKWVTVNEDEQAPAHMPAYQWVVLKDKTAEKLAATSPLTFNNREFNGSYAVQLRKDGEAAEYYYSASTLFNSADSLEFVEVPATALSDSLLGYKNFEANDLLVNRYTFNYLHAYADDKYLAKSADDSLATVLDGKQAFAIEAEGTIARYGYIVSDAVKARIPGLKQLYRQAYKVYVPAVKKAYLGYNNENKFAITAETTGMTASKVSFWFKENNDLEGENNCYHAMIVVPTSTEDYSKAGVTDDDLSATLKHQVYSETRTSAFLIAPYDAPLYRRFNSEKLEGNKDQADTLRFIEKYRGEMLQVEANQNFKREGVDFLGIDDADFTTDGKAFIVDTAWIGNGLKPQYLISIDRNNNGNDHSIMCPICKEIVENGGERPANCPHDETYANSFHFGLYLVNFADSTDSKYAWKGYDRAGFVKAAHQGDSLFILKDQFADWTVADFDSAKLVAAVKAIVK